MSDKAAKETVNDPILQTQNSYTGLRSIIQRHICNGSHDVLIFGRILIQNKDESLYWLEHISGRATSRNTGD